MRVRSAGKIPFWKTLEPDETNEMKLSMGTLRAVGLVLLTTVTMAGCAGEQEPSPQLKPLVWTEDFPAAGRDTVRLLQAQLEYLSEYSNIARADLDGDGEDEIIVLGHERFYRPGQQETEVSGILEIKDGDPQYLKHFAFHEYNSAPTIRDFNGDGRLDLLYVASSGGNCSGCTWHRLVWWDGLKFAEQDLMLVYDLYDFDADGAVELVTNVPWQGIWPDLPACEFSGQALRDLLYTPQTILKWDGGRYRAAPQDFPVFFALVHGPFVEEKIAEAGSWLQEAEAEHNVEFAALLRCWILWLEPLRVRARLLGG